MRKITILLVSVLCMVLITGCSIGNSSEQKSENKEGWINPPEGDMYGKYYEDVIKSFEDAGFTNVRTEKIEDFFIAVTSSDFVGKVEDVTIDGRRYKENKLYDPTMRLTKCS